MKNFPPRITEILKNLTSLVYCYKITLKNRLWPLYLTSNSESIIVQNIKFMPDSGLNIKESLFNDSAKSYIFVEGIFENDGINASYDLTDALVEIMLLANDELIPFVAYYCTLYTKYDLNFVIQLEPETIKYNRSLLNCFSKNCLAVFGDAICKVNKELYLFNLDIAFINGKIITVVDCPRENGYFTDGEVVLYQENFITKIISHKNNIFELQELPSINITSTRITVIAGCDKNFQTCCNKFNNAVNFREEPFIPDNNFLENIFLCKI